MDARDGIFGNRRDFRELLHSTGGGVASNIRSNRLERLVAADLLSREGATHGQGAGYSLTEAGIETPQSWSRWENWGLAHPGRPRELRTRAAPRGRSSLDWQVRCYG